jgi:uncharacterized membrane protein HdeD (DUF308 family)
VTRAHPPRAYGRVLVVDKEEGPVMTAGADPKSWWSSWGVPMLVGVISLIAGILAIVWPDVTLLALALIAGINLTVLSAFVIGETLADDEAQDKTLRVVLGVLGVIAGLVIIRRPGETLLVLIVAVGIWLVLDGIVDIVRAFLRGEQHRVLLVLSGLIDAILGIVILSWPKLGLGTLAVLIGIGFVVRGIMLMVGAWRLRSAAHHLKDSGLTGPATPPAPAV